MVLAKEGSLVEGVLIGEVACLGDLVLLRVEDVG